MPKKANIDPALIAFIITGIAAIFLLGAWTAHKGWQPFIWIEQSFSTSAELIKQPFRKRPPMLEKIRYNGIGVVEHDAEKAYNGLTVLQGSMPGGVQLRLVDMAGDIIHLWPIDYFKIWPNPKHLPKANRPKTRFNFHSQGMVVFPDGSIVVNIGDKGSVKLDKCGKVEWTVDHMTHHSITMDEHGNFWIPSHSKIKDIDKALLFGKMTNKELQKKTQSAFHSYENTILMVDKNGKTIKEFSVLQALYDAGMESHIYDALSIRSTDPTHVNDIEIATPALAKNIAAINTGDLIVSIRQMHMLAALDQHTGELKWYYQGPWIRQHDLDITATGNIEIFNNGDEKIVIDRLPGSNIMELDTRNMTTQILYPVKKFFNNNEPFYSHIMGTHQKLPNGNRLITESTAGRVFEVNNEGKTVWDSLVNYDKTHASLIAEAERFDMDYFTVDSWSCQK